MSGSYNIQPSEKTEIIRGRENVLNAVVKFATNAKSRIDVCLDQTRPALMVAIEIGPTVNCLPISKGGAFTLGYSLKLLLAISHLVKN